MSAQKTSYRQLLKASTIFGGVQVFNIIVGLIRSKFIAVLLGPTGVGITSLFMSTTSLISSLSGFGLGTSAVNYIAEANATNDLARISFVVKVLRCLVWMTGLLGFIFTASLSSFLSEFTFGNKEYTLSLLFISVTLLISQLSIGYEVLLQGTRQIRQLSKAVMIGSFLGLILNIPLYYFYGLKGIVPSIIISSLTSFFLNRYFARKFYLVPIILSKARTLVLCKGMLTMGFMISLSGILNAGASYFIRIFIMNSGGVEELGFYSAGFTILNSYVGLIFVAMGTDYYPRLTAVASNNLLSKEVINHQAEIAVLIIAPIIITFLVFIKWIIIIVYSPSFLPIHGMLKYASIGILFKAATWAVGFIFLSKRESKMFFFSELASNFYLLVFNIIGYKFWGLTGLGVSFLISYIFSLIQVLIISKLKFEFAFSRVFCKVFLIQIFLTLGCVVTVNIFEGAMLYIGGVLFIISSLYFSIKEMDNRIDFKSILLSKMTKI